MRNQFRLEIQALTSDAREFWEAALYAEACRFWNYIASRLLTFTENILLGAKLSSIKPTIACLPGRCRKNFRWKKTRTTSFSTITCSRKVTGLAQLLSIFDVAFATGLAALTPGCVIGWHDGDWLRLWSEERERFVRKLAYAISVEGSDR